MEKKLAVILAVCIVTSVYLCTGTVFSKTIEEEITATPVKTVTPGDEDIISSAALKVLRHIAQARGDIHDKKIAQAMKAVKQARALIGVIKEARPVTRVKDHIWVAKKHLSYEDTEEVMPDLIAIYTSLDEIEDFVPVKKSRRHIDKAKKNLKQGNREKAKKELKLADEALIYTEIDLPLASTEKHVIAAQGYLAQNRTDVAEKELRAAEHGVYFITSAVKAPVTQAKKSLWKATKDYAAGKYAAAKEDLDRAGDWLKRAEKSVDGKTRAEAEKMGKDIDTLTLRIARGGKETMATLQGLLSRSRALAEREAERVSIGWQNLSAGSKAKAHLIDAKLHLAYAESEQFIDGESADIKSDLDRAEKELHLALELVDESVMDKIAGIEKEIDVLKAKIHSKEAAAGSHYEKVKADLRQLIHDM